VVAPLEMKEGTISLGARTQSAIQRAAVLYKPRLATFNFNINFNFSTYKFKIDSKKDNRENTSELPHSRGNITALRVSPNFYALSIFDSDKTLC
jgi:hypothetical protein